MYAQVLEANGFEVDREGIGLDNETIAHQALLNGDIDLYPEYVATALQAILEQDLPTPPAREQIYTAVKDAYANLDPSLAVLQPSGFEDNQALAMRRERAEELGISTYSDLSTRAGELVLGGPAEFFERPDGVRGLQEAYGGFQFQENRQLTPALRYPELEQGNVDVIVAFTTDGQLSDEQFLVLEDDKQFYPPYQVAPIVRQDVLDRSPQIADLLNGVTAKLTEDETMAALNFAVDGPDGREVEDVAREFLQEQGLVQ
jgi:osmoprotectant transport system substrate-binding protein